MSRHGCRSSLTGPRGVAGLTHAAARFFARWGGTAGLVIGACGGLGEGRPAKPSRSASTPIAAEVAPIASPAAPAPASVSLRLTQAVERPVGLEPERGKPSLVWRFRSAAPLSGPPAVSNAGLVYVATVEGYVHALEPDGAFRWSYGLVGMPVGAPAVDPDGRVYVATSAQRLYALRPDGRLGWMQHAPTRFATPPVWASPGLIYYAGRDRHLYSVAEWNGRPERRYLGHAASAELASLGGGVVAVSTTGSDAQVYRRSSLVARLALDAEPAQPLLGGQERWFAVTREGIAALGLTSGELIWKAPAQRAAASPDERVVIVQRERELFWLSPETGAELRRARLPGDVSALPVVTNAGVAVVPLVSGSLVVIEPLQGRMARINVGSAPAWSPVWSERSWRVTAAAAGAVVGVDLSAWSAPGSPSAADVETAPAPPPGAATDGDPARPGLGSSRVLAADAAEGGA